jgi:hypothetical protein
MARHVATFWVTLNFPGFNREMHKARRGKVLQFHLPCGDHPTDQGVD